MAAATPGVRWPPPLAFLAALAVGYALQLAVPVPVLPEWLRWGGALVLGLPGAGLFAWTLREMRRARTPVEPWHAAESLLTHGPFALSRNPIYLGMTALTGALGLALGLPWALAALALVVAVIDRAVIAREEAHLAARFGGAYDAYRRRTRRWV